MDKTEKIDCTTCKYGYEDERLGIPMCHHPKRFSEDCIDFNMHEGKHLDTLSGKDALPCWKKVHTYTEELREGDLEKMLLDLSVGKWKRETKIALPDKVVDTLSEEPDKSLEEAAEKYCLGTEMESPYVRRLKGQAFIAGWKFRDDQMPMPEDTVLFQKGVAEGRRLEREDMLKDAVKGKVNQDGFLELSNGEVIDICPTLKRCALGLHIGDKVRIVVLKEEEE